MLEFGGQNRLDTRRTWAVAQDMGKPFCGVALGSYGKYQPGLVSRAFIELSAKPAGLLRVRPALGLQVIVIIST
jgi:hypothetical protein